MSSVPMPVDLSEETLKMWLQMHGGSTYVNLARAVRALVEREVAKERASTREKVREAVAEMKFEKNPWIISADAIVARVMGEEAPRA